MSWRNTLSGLSYPTGGNQVGNTSTGLNTAYMQNLNQPYVGTLDPTMNQTTANWQDTLRNLGGSNMAEQAMSDSRIGNITDPPVGQTPGMSGYDMGRLALGGLQTLAGLWGSRQAHRLARDQFRTTRDHAETNLTNQIQSYNTALSDRSHMRAQMAGQDPSTAQEYIDRHSLRR